MSHNACIVVHTWARESARCAVYPPPLSLFPGLTVFLTLVCVCACVCKQCVVKVPRAEYISFAYSAIGNTLLVWAFLGETKQISPHTHTHTRMKQITLSPHTHTHTLPHACTHIPSHTHCCIRTRSISVANSCQYD